MILILHWMISIMKNGSVNIETILKQYDRTCEGDIIILTVMILYAVKMPNALCYVLNEFLFEQLKKEVGKIALWGVNTKLHMFFLQSSLKNLICFLHFLRRDIQDF